MPSLINALLGSDITKMGNEVIANDMIAGSKAASQAYLNATLECATPELSRLFTKYMNQALETHEVVTDLAVQKGWYKPYESISGQLADTYKQSTSIVQQPNI